MKANKITVTINSMTVNLRNGNNKSKTNINSWVAFLFKAQKHGEDVHGNMAFLTCLQLWQLFAYEILACTVLYDSGNKLF